jgi:hypothetical protein
MVSVVPVHKGVGGPDFAAGDTNVGIGPIQAETWRCNQAPVNVLVTDGTGVLAARQATDTMPIVFADPLAEGLVGTPDAGWLVITPVLNTDS